MHDIRKIAKTSRPEFAVLVVTLVTTLVAELEFAIYVGVICRWCSISTAPRTEFHHARPRPGEQTAQVRERAQAPLECPQLKIVRIDGSVFFGAVNHVAEQLDLITREDPEQAHILVAAAASTSSTSPAAR